MYRYYSKSVVIILLFIFLTPKISFADTISYNQFNEKYIDENKPNTLCFHTNENRNIVLEKIRDICEYNNEIVRYYYDFYAYNYCVRFVYRDTTIDLYKSEKTKIHEEAVRILDEIISESFTDYKKLYLIYNWIQNKVDYDYDASEELKVYDRGRGYYKQNAEDVLFTDDALCAGYADALYYLCNMCGVETKFVLGKFGVDKPGNNHVWNVVKLRDEWYFVDATDESGYAFLRGTEWMKNHGYVWDEEYLVVDVSNMDYGF